MIINLNELNNKKIININYEVIKDDSLDKRIIALKNSYVKGKIFLDHNNDIVLDLDFKGTMIIPDSITLEAIPYNFQIKIDTNIEDIIENNPNCYEIMQNTLDLKELLWQNIVLEVPISYSLNNDANLKGNGWEFNKGENKTSDSIDPRLKKLDDLLKGDD